MRSAAHRVIASLREVLMMSCFASMIIINSVDAQTCPASGIGAGVDADPRDFDTLAGQRYLLFGKGNVNCKGVIKEWIFFTNSTCNSSIGNIEFEIWRPQGIPPAPYQLVGKNFYSSQDCIMLNESQVTFGIDPVHRIPVEPGYIIGWYQSDTSPAIRYDNVTDINSFYYAYGDSSRGLGYLQTFPQNSGNLSDFSIMVTIIQGDYPTFDNLPAMVSIAENVPSTLSVFSVSASHISNNQFMCKDAVFFSFSLSPSTEFTMTNSSNGNAIIVTSAVINYEQQNVYQLSVTVTALGLSTTKILTINILDVNEPHNIINLPNNTIIPAPSTAAGNQIFLVLITDQDINPPIPVRFYLNSWSSPYTMKDVPPFTIDPVTGSVTTSEDLSGWYLHYPTKTPYPTFVTYDLNIQATDGVYSDTQVLTVNITHIKQPPTILNLPGNVTINENMPVNSVIYQVLVSPSSDPILRFQINTQPTPFCIDELSGLVSICSYAKLSVCQLQTYTLNITVTNSVLSQWALLIVFVRWVNVAPGFSQSTYSGSIEENCPSNGIRCTPLVTVTSVNVNDPNCIPPDSRNCSISPGDGSQFFDMQSCSSVLNIISIDIDLFPEYENILLLIKVFDSGNLADYAFVNVSVIDINDNAPAFSQSVYNGFVDENAVGGTSVLTVSASDLDRGRNGKIYFSISATDPSFLYFQVDPKSGLIATKQPLDYEKGPTVFNLIVWATDEGSVGRSSSAIVVITVRDVNDNRPQFLCSNRPSDEPYPPQPCFYNYDLLYDVSVGSNVSDLLLTASDVDPQPYVIDFNQLETDYHFTLNQSNGLITVAKKVDAYKKYLLYVYAEDNGIPPLKSRIMYIRIDTYRRERHWIDLTVRPETTTFDSASFLKALRNVTSPWFMKIVSTTTYDKAVQKEVVVTVYALADNSTYALKNIANDKVFVSRDDMLKKLRRNIYGEPESILRGAMFEGIFPVIKVMPSYVIWWTDTVEGIATIVCLSVIPILITAVVAVAICKSCKLLCFKPKASPNPSTMAKSGATKTGPTQNSTQENIRYRSGRGRRDSVLTVHSAVWGKDL